MLIRMGGDDEKNVRIKRGDPKITGRVFEIRTASVEDKGKNTKKSDKK